MTDTEQQGNDLVNEVPELSIYLHGYRMLEIIRRVAKNTCCFCCNTCLACDAHKLLQSIGLKNELDQRKR